MKLFKYQHSRSTIAQKTLLLLWSSRTLLQLYLYQIYSFFDVFSIFFFDRVRQDKSLWNNRFLFQPIVHDTFGCFIGFVEIFVSLFNRIGAIHEVSTTAYNSNCNGFPHPLSNGTMSKTT